MATLLNEWRISGVICESRIGVSKPKNGQPGKEYASIVVETIGATVELDGMNVEDVRAMPVGAEVSMVGRGVVVFERLRFKPVKVEVLALPGQNGSQGRQPAVAAGAK